MADLSLTSSAVVASAAALATRRRCVLGATLAAGDVIYLDATDSHKAKAADANSGTAAARVPVGILLNGGAAGQPAEYIEADTDLTVGSHGLTVGTAIILSATAGKMAPIADATTGWYPTLIGIAKTSTTISFNARAALSLSAALS